MELFLLVDLKFESICFSKSSSLHYGTLNLNAKMKINWEMRRIKSFQKLTQTEEKTNQLGEFLLSLQWLNLPSMNFQAAASSSVPPPRQLPPPFRPPPSLVMNLLMILSCRDSHVNKMVRITLRLKFLTLLKGEFYSL